VLEQAVREHDDGTRSIAGRGTLLATLGDGDPARIDGTTVFGSATMTLAEPSVVADHLRRATGNSVGLEIGALQQLPDVPATLHAGGFGRHTFLCGQSGSGKTYTLGLVLERLLLDTDIRLAVLDPNSDYVNMSTLRAREDTGLADDAYAALAQRFAGVAERIHVFGGPSAPVPLRAWFSRLTFEQQTMVLGVDPYRDPDEYNAFVRIREALAGRDYSLHDVLAQVHTTFADDQRRLGLRIENLGVADFAIWAGEGHRGVGDALADEWRMLVVDLGTLGSETESSIAAAAILGHLWERRHARQPIVIVVDEAHNVCPENPHSPHQALATEHLVRIAGEGRKFGLYVLLATQRPEKVNRNVVSQCDNLILMKMNSAVDINALAEIFSFAPRSLVEQAAGFDLGEGLAAGRIAPDPILFRSGHRLTVEGGSDVPSTWARRS
jgi:hypothetical protein